MNARQRRGDRRLARGLMGKDVLLRSRRGRYTQARVIDVIANGTTVPELLLEREYDFGRQKEREWVRLDAVTHVARAPRWSEG